MTGKIKKHFRSTAAVQVLLDLWSEWVQKGKVTLFLSLSLSALVKVSSLWLTLRLQDNAGQIQKFYRVILKGYKIGAIYRGSPTYTKITNTVSTNAFFGLCMCKGGN